MIESTDEAAAKHALESSSQEYSEIDALLIKLATGGLGLSVALGVFRDGQQTRWLMASWFILLVCVLVVLVSKYLSVEANRAFYLSKKHDDPDTRESMAEREKQLDPWVKWTNWIGGGLFFMGTISVVCHVVAIG